MLIWTVHKLYRLPNTLDDVDQWFSEVARGSFVDELAPTFCSDGTRAALARAHSTPCGPGMAARWSICCSETTYLIHRPRLKVTVLLRMHQAERDGESFQTEFRLPRKAGSSTSMSHAYICTSENELLYSHTNNEVEPQNPKPQ
jgi:hypothetical protein